MATWATKDGFFACKVPREKVTVPGIGDIWVYGLTAGEKDDYENSVMQLRGGRLVRMASARVTLLLMTIHNQHGHKLFGAKDVGRLKMVPASVIDPILDVARRLSGMATGELDELVKNSLTLQGLDDDGSSTESPTPEAGPSAKPESGSAATS